MKIHLNYTMLCDFYELTMANGYFQTDIAQQICYRDTSAPGRRPRPLPAYDIIAVHHPAPAVGGNRDASPDMTYHIITFFIFFMEYGLAVPYRGFFQIQGMEVDDPADPFDPCHPGQILQFIHIRRINDHCLCPVFFCKFIGKLRS